MPNYKTCLLSIYLLLFGLTSFAQTESVPKNIVTINTFGFYRLYIPFFEAEYERKINNKFAIKVGYTFISKHNAFNGENERRSRNKHKGYGFSFEVLKTISKPKASKKLSLGVELTFRKVSSDITAKSNENISIPDIIINPDFYDYRDSQYGYSPGCGGNQFLCLVSDLDRFAHNKTDYGLNFLIHYRFYKGKRKRVVFDFQTGLGLFYRSSYHIGRDFKNFNLELNESYQGAGNKILFNFPFTLNFGYRF